jgi:hypothetical protein
MIHAAPSRVVKSVFSSYHFGADNGLFSQNPLQARAVNFPSTKSSNLLLTQMLKESNMAAPAERVFIINLLPQIFHAPARSR